LGQPKVEEGFGAVGMDACGEGIVGRAAGLAFFGGIDTRCSADKHEALNLVGVGKSNVKSHAPTHRIAHPQRWPAHGLDQQVGGTP
jgi:hypothetical protein